MFLGTPRPWLIAAAVSFLAGLALVGLGNLGTWGNVLGVLLVILGMILFAAAPMRYGEKARKRAPESNVAEPASASTAPPRPAVKVEAGDPSEV